MTCDLQPIYRNAKSKWKTWICSMTPFNHVIFEGFQRYVIRCTVVHQRYNKSANLGGMTAPPLPPPVALFIHIGISWEILGNNCCGCLSGGLVPAKPLVNYCVWIASDVSSWFCPRFTFWFRHQAPRAPDKSSKPMTHNEKCTLWAGFGPCSPGAFDTRPPEHLTWALS